MECNAVIPNPNITPIIYNHILFKDGGLKQFLKELSDVYNKFGLDSRLNIRDYLLAEMTFNFLAIVNNTIDKEFEMKVCNEPENSEFKDGDIIFTRIKACEFKDESMWLSIFKKIDSGNICCYLDICLNTNKLYHYGVDIILCDTSQILEERLATEEEKKRLFDAIKEHGYRWNTETKTLEEIHKDRFDPSTLKPFDRVLVRAVNNEYWKVNLFGSYMRGWSFPFLCVGKEVYRQCIPYEGNEHLLGTTNDCDDFYKTWEYCYMSGGIFDYKQYYIDDNE